MSYVTADTVSWWQRARGDDDDLLVAYFSMEFGIHERLPIYSGGLGVLAGDHLKAAAELGVPLVGVGLLYTGGYFRQGIDKSGRQTEDYQPVDPEAVGLVREDVSVTVELAGETIEAAVWRKDVASAVGVVPLYLLEVDWLTDALYGGDREHRIRQELLLGVGGVRALAALGIEPNVFHLNEGHSAFLQLERAARARRRRRGDRRRARVDPPLLRLHDAHARAGGQRGLRRGARLPLRRRPRRRGRARPRAPARRWDASATSPASA